MRRKWETVPKYITGLLGSVLVVLVVQYALLTGLIEPIHPLFLIMQTFCYMLLGVAVFRGLIERSRLAWLVAQIMLAALFAASLLFATLSFVLAQHTEGFFIMVAVALLVAVLDGLMLGILFSLPVYNYFRPEDEDESGTTTPQ